MRKVLIVLLPDNSPGYDYFSWSKEPGTETIKVSRGNIFGAELSEGFLADAQAAYASE